MLRRNKESGYEYNLQLGSFDSDEEGNILRTPRSALQLVSQGIAGIPHPSTPPLPHTPTPTPLPPPPPQPPSFTMENTMKFPVF